MKIILVGYMGSGKSTIGKTIASNVGFSFYDLDEIIEKEEKQSIKKIFEEKGEIYFRKIESAFFNSFVNKNNNFILALGGGTPCYAGNDAVLKQNEVVSFYLKGSIDTLTDRLKNDKINRPLIANLTNEQLKNYIAKHLFDRSYYYLQSKYVIDIDEKSIDEVVQEILKKLA